MPLPRGEARLSSVDSEKRDLAAEEPRWRAAAYLQEGTVSGLANREE